jgi:hypothetical protein
MGLRDITNIEFDPNLDAQLLSDLHSLVKFSILETFEPDYYARSNTHTRNAIEKHRLLFEKYPEHYREIFSNKEIVEFMLDAHIIMFSLFLLTTDSDMELILNNLKRVQVNRIFLLFKNALNAQEFIGSPIEKGKIRTLFYYFLERLEAERKPSYCVYYGVKYRHALQDLFASLRVKKEKLSDLWQEISDFLFINKSKRGKFNYPLLNEINELRKNDDKINLEELKQIPFSTFIGYAWRIYNKHFTDPEAIKKEIFKRTDLMTNNELKKYLKLIEQAGGMKKNKEREKIKERLERAPSSIIAMLNALFVTEKKSKQLLLQTLEKKLNQVIKQVKSKLESKNIGIAIDVSGNTAGYQYLLEPKFQQQLNEGQPIPKWAKNIMRRIFPKNLTLGYVISKASMNPEFLLFNDTLHEIKVADLDTAEFLNALTKFESDGGTAPLFALEELIKKNPDVIVMISDFNENVPFKGALRQKLPELAKEYGKPIILLQTDVDISELTSLENTIFEKNLANVMLIPIYALEQLDKIMEMLDLEEKKS